MSQFKVRSPKKWQKEKKNKRRNNHSNTRNYRYRKNTKMDYRKIFKLFFFTGLGVFLIGFITFLAMIVHYGKDIPDPNRLIERKVAQSSKIYDRTGEHLLYEFHNDIKRTIINYENIPTHAINAVIAIEDRDFYNNKFGLSLKRNIKAIIYYVLEKITGGRIRGPGGSGITQQLVKNAILTNERKVSRKIKEWILTVKIEGSYSKNEILQMYFNEIPYGSVVYGIEAASQFYFGVPAQDLSIAQSALLAGLINRPSYLSPYGSHQDELFERQQLVLNLMHEQNYITQEELKVAQEEKIEFMPRIDKIEAPHFVFYVKELLTEKYNYSEKQIAAGGYNIITTLDYGMQKKAEQVLLDNKEFLNSYEANNAALVSIDSTSGDILAMVGSIDFNDIENDGNVNVAVRPRQPGSSFKPLVYAVGFEKGYTPQTATYDVKTIFKTEQGTDYVPNNYDLKERGLINFKNSLAGSLNITSVKMMHLAGVNNALNKIDELGYTTFSDRSRFGLSLVLGGGEVKLLEHVAAYTAFANQGKMSASRAIISMKDANDEILEDFSENSWQVWDENVANQINDILSDTEARKFVFGTDPNFTLKNQVAAVKTGTTNDYRDAWLMGYTPSVVTGVWVGNNDNSKMKKGATGGRVAAPVWKQYMDLVYEDKDNEEFIEPEEIDSELKPILKGEVEDIQIVRIDKVSGKLATEFTPESKVEERYYIIPHSLLHYVKLEEPQANIPSEDERDVAYQLWEDGIREWYKRKQKEASEDDSVVFEEAKEFCKDKSDNPDCEKIIVHLTPPPVEYDDVHTIDSIPTISILHPADFDNLTENNQFVKVIAESKENRIKKVDFYLDSTFLGSDEKEPYFLQYNLQDISNGFYNLKAIVYDEFDNNTKAQITVQVNTKKTPITFEWTHPKPYSRLNVNEFPINLSGELSRFSAVTTINFYYQNSNDRKLIATALSPESNNINIQWDDYLLPGDYTIWAYINTRTGDQVISEPLNITIDR